MTIRLAVGNPVARRGRAGAWTVEAIGVTIGLAAVRNVLTHPVPPPLRMAEFGLAIGASALLVYGGYRLGTGDRQPTEQWRIAVWTGVGALFATLFGLSILLHQRVEGGVIVEPGSVLLMLAAAGASLGLLSSVASCAAQRSQPPLPDDAGSTDLEGLDSASPYDVSLDDELVRRWLAESVVEDADRQRLLVVRYLHRHPHALFTVDDLADHLLDTDDEADGNAVSRALRLGQLHIQLRHSDLPMLADAGLISYQPPLVQYLPEERD